MSEIAINVENLSKAYRIGQKEEVPDTLLSAVASVAKSPLRNFRRLSRLDTFRETGEADDLVWALRDVSFDVKRGEVVGVIGRNGAGKSTLLKILSRITEPTSGRAVIHGRVSSLLEVGTGFHPELTGRENIYMNGTILGMKKREIDAKFDEIVDFSGVEKFLDTPVKRYSSGMKVRLAFSVAAHLEPEILIIDEVLAVGDAEFQSKCLGKMQSVASDGRTVLFVSHNMPAVRSLTDVGMFLDGGCINYLGKTERAISAYLDRNLCVRTGDILNLEPYRRDTNADSPVRITGLRFGDSDQEDDITRIKSSEPIAAQIIVESTIDVASSCVAIILTRNMEQRVVTIFSRDTGVDLSLCPGCHEIRCEIANLPLAPGHYTATVGINRNWASKAFDVLLDVPAFDIEMEEAVDGTLEWQNRPWGGVHWDKVEWSLSLAHPDKQLKRAFTFSS